MSGFWAALSAAIFTGDREWAWRRRVAISSAATMLAGIVHSIFFDRDLAHATMVMSNCQTGLALVLSIYVAGAITDDKFKRDANKAPGTP